MEKMHHRFINPLTPGPFLPKTHFLDILEIFSLDMSQISSNLLKKALQYDSMPFFLLASRFTTFCSSMRGKFWMMKRPTSLGFWFFNFFFCLSLFSCCYLFAAVIDHLLGYLPVQKIPRRHNRVGQFLPWSSHV